MCIRDSGGTRLLMANDTTVDGTPASLEGQTIGVVKDTASAQVLKNVVPGATLKSFTTPKEALDAFYAGDVSILGGGTLWLAANSRNTWGNGRYYGGWRNGGGAWGNGGGGFVNW